MKAEDRETLVELGKGTMGNIFTKSRKLAKHLLRVGCEPSKEGPDGRELPVGTWAFEIPKSWVSIRKPRSKNRGV